jgi:hypothetical protein
MKDEIKEILNITETADYKKLSVDELIVIKDYIIDLQVENRQTKLLNELYKLRNEKAREMISFIAFNSERPLTITELNKVYNILQGSDK